MIKKIYMINNEKNAIYCYKFKGPIFGGSDFNIQSDMKHCMSYTNKYTNIYFIRYRI